MSTATKDRPARIILNKTRSSKERFYLDLSNGVPVIEVNKHRTSLADLLAQPETLVDRQKVIEYLTGTEHEHLLNGHANGHTDQPVLGKPMSEDKPAPGLAWPDTVQMILDKSDPKEQDMLMAAYFGTLNGTKGKGATRRLRKALHGAGHRRLAALAAT